ncbi:MAG: enoyl-CoA hydratase [Syntrophobacterales bacterium]|nr:enoyl-CoA hydratase [Syntrophobacterales bacterium]
MAEKAALLEKIGNIAKITMNNPTSLNSMTQALLDDTRAALREVEEDQEVRAVIFTGAGRAFCAGGDLPYILTFDNIAKSRRYIQDIAEIVNLIVHMSKPVIAMVNGVAAGAGFSLALACDLIFCGRAARFSQSFVRIGLIPDGSATYFLPRTVGLHRAKELMFTGDIIDADRAFQIGLVNRVIADEQLWDQTLDFARQLSRYAPLAIGLMKKILNQSDKLDLQAGIELETGIQLFCLGTEDHREGVNAFLEKRAPVFQGR